VRPLHLILDTSAVLAYASGSEHVGEPISQVQENGAAFTVPLTSLAVSAAAVGDSWIELLTSHPAFERVETRWIRWSAYAEMIRLVGRLDAAEALLAALDFHCDVLTAEASLYSALGDDPPIIAI
jgi:hypothetical protein